MIKEWKMPIIFFPSLSFRKPPTESTFLAHEESLVAPQRNIPIIHSSTYFNQIDTATFTNPNPENITIQSLVDGEVNSNSFAGSSIRKKFLIEDMRPKTMVRRVRILCEKHINIPGILHGRRSVPLYQAGLHPGLRRTPTFQLESATVSNEEISLPLPLVKNHPQKMLPGFVDGAGIYREWQIGNLCGMHALNTVLHSFFGEQKILTQGEFEKKVPHQWSTIKDLSYFADKADLEAKPYYAEIFNDSKITYIDDAKAFIIIAQPSGQNSAHYVAMVRPTVQANFHLSDSSNQKEGQMYPIINEHETCTATEALLDYQKRNNVIAKAVIAFYERNSAHGTRFTTTDIYNNGITLYRNGSLKDALEAFNEVIPRIRDLKGPRARKVLAKTLYSKGRALSKSGLWKEAIETYDEVIRLFGNSPEPALAERVVNARERRHVALEQCQASQRNSSK
jgi:hypothetical protein